MNWNPAAAIAILLSIAGYFVAGTLLRGRSTRFLICFATIAGVLALPGVVFALDYLHAWTQPAWYFELRSFPWSELLTSFIGSAAAAVALFRWRILWLPGFVVTLLLSSLPYVKPIIRPLNGALAPLDDWNGGVCLQTSAATCGPASAATVLHALGLSASERELADESRSCASGTEAWYLARALRTRGCTVRFTTSFSPHEELSMPCIAGVSLPGGAGHFVAILGKSGDRTKIGEPLHGLLALTPEELGRLYTFSGFAMRVEKR